MRECFCRAEFGKKSNQKSQQIIQTLVTVVGLTGGGSLWWLWELRGQERGVKSGAFLEAPQLS